jgi:hypothetical protein
MFLPPPLAECEAACRALSLSSALRAASSAVLSTPRGLDIPVESRRHNASPSQEPHRLEKTGASRSGTIAWDHNSAKDRPMTAPHATW